MELCLCDCEINKEYVISKIVQNDMIKNRLMCFGFLPKEKIKLLKYNYKNTCCLVKVMGINYAVDKKVCEGIIVCV